MTDIDTVAEAIWRATAPAAVSFDEISESSRDVFRSMAQAAIDALQLTQFWAVSSGDGYRDDIVREHWDEARDDLAETIAAGDDDAYMVTAWFTGWERAE